MSPKSQVGGLKDKKEKQETVNVGWTQTHLLLLLLFSRSVVSSSSRPHGLQHTRLPCPSLSPGVFSNSRPLSLWCHPTISSSVASFYPCHQSFPTSGSFPMSRLLESSGQRIGTSNLASVLPLNIQGPFPLGLTGLIPCSPRDSQESSIAPQFEGIKSLVLSLLYLGPLNFFLKGNPLKILFIYWLHQVLVVARRLLPSCGTKA